MEELSAEDKERLKFIRTQKVQVLKNIESLKLELHDITNQIQSLGFPIDCVDPVSWKRQVGCREFNNDAKMGLDYLFSNGLIEKDAESVAKLFIEESEHLSKLSIGNYIGEVRKDFNMQVLDAFTKFQDFSNQSILAALRHFLLKFKLPGESQKIDRILTSFAEHYVNQNPGVFTSSHEAHFLVYAIILLNTTLHNSNAKNQNIAFAEEKEFVHTILNADDTSFDEEVIRQIYREIKSEPIKVISDEYNGNNPDLAGVYPTKSFTKGWLLKLGGRVKTWKRRWFVLTDDSLFYYLTPDRCRQSKGVIPLEGLAVRVSQDRSKEFTFEIFSLNTALIRASKVIRDGAATPSSHRVYRLAATSTVERDRWLHLLQHVTNRLNERRVARSVSVGCSPANSVNGFRAAAAATSGGIGKWSWTNSPRHQQSQTAHTRRHRLPSPVSSATCALPTTTTTTAVTSTATASSSSHSSDAGRLLKGKPGVVSSQPDLSQRSLLG